MTIFNSRVLLLALLLHATASMAAPLWNDQVQECLDKDWTQVAFAAEPNESHHRSALQRYVTTPVQHLAYNVSYLLEWPHPYGHTVMTALKYKLARKKYHYSYQRACATLCVAKRMIKYWDDMPLALNAMSAPAAVEFGAGMCMQYAAIQVSLLQALGITARPVSYKNIDWELGHAFVEVKFNGRGEDGARFYMDPTYDRGCTFYLPE